MVSETVLSETMLSETMLSATRTSRMLRVVFLLLRVLWLLRSVWSARAAAVAQPSQHKQLMLCELLVATAVGADEARPTSFAFAPLPARFDASRCGTGQGQTPCHPDCLGACARDDVPREA